MKNEQSKINQLMNFKNINDLDVIAKLNYSQFLKALEVNPPQDANHSKTNKANKWTGDLDYNTAKQYAITGHDETAEKVRKKSEELNVVGIHERILKDEYYLSDEPSLGMFDIESFLSGNPEYWVESKETEGNRKKEIATILVNLGVSCSWEKERFFKRGAVLTSFVEALEIAGVSTEIYFAIAVKNGSSHSEIYVNLKESHQNFDFSKLSYALSHVGFFRRLGFRLLELLPKQTREALAIGRFYGEPAKFKYIEEVFDNNDSLLTIDSSNKLTEFPHEWIEESLSKFDIKIK